MDSFAPETIVLAAAIAVIAGVVRGITGFGGAMGVTAKRTGAARREGAPLHEMNWQSACSR